MEGTQQECGRKMTGGKKHDKRTTGSLEGYSRIQNNDGKGFFLFLKNT